MRRLFGTDGIRGIALEPPLDRPTVGRLGSALAELLSRRQTSPGLLLAGDTRASTEVLAGWLAESYQAAGGRVTWAGVLPTPAVSHLLRAGGYAAGAVISASHNPAADNGIKVLGPGGEKLPEAAEEELEALMEAARPTPGPPLPPPDRSLVSQYVDLLLKTHDRCRPLAGLSVVVDAAHGAASGLAEAVLEALGARVEAIASDPDGLNINRGCGATAPQTLAEAGPLTGRALRCSPWTATPIAPWSWTSAATCSTVTTSSSSGLATSSAAAACGVGRWWPPS